MRVAQGGRFSHQKLDSWFILGQYECSVRIFDHRSPKSHIGARVRFAVGETITWQLDGSMQTVDASTELCTGQELLEPKKFKPTSFR